MSAAPLFLRIAHNYPIPIEHRDGSLVDDLACWSVDGEALAISIPRSEVHMIRHQERMPYGLFVPEVPTS